MTLSAFSLWQAFMTTFQNRIWMVVAVLSTQWAYSACPDRLAKRRSYRFACVLCSQSEPFRPWHPRSAAWFSEHDSQNGLGRSLGSSYTTKRLREPSQKKGSAVLSIAQSRRGATLLIADSRMRFLAEEAPFWPSRDLTCRVPTHESCAFQTKSQLSRTYRWRAISTQGDSDDRKQKV